MPINQNTVSDTLKEKAGGVAGQFPSQLTSATKPIPTNASANKLEDANKTTAAQPTFTSAKQVLDSALGWNENALNALQQSAYKIRFYASEDIPLLANSAPTYAEFMKKLNS